MTVYETDLPGVGKKFEVELGRGETLVIVIHNTGKREVYRKSGPDADAKKLFEAPNNLARTIGSILEGAKFQPIEADKDAAMLPGETVIEWFTVAGDSPLDGHCLGDGLVREHSAVLIAAIQRGDEILSSPGAETSIEAEDIVIVIGPRDSVIEFESLVAPPETDEQ